MQKVFTILILSLFFGLPVNGQLKWQNVDSLYQPLPSSVHVYFTDQPLDDTSKFRAYYLIADIKDKKLDFTVDTTLKRRLTPSKFYDKNDKPLLVVNTTFFSFTSNKNLNVVIKNKKLLGYNIHTINGRGKDTFTYKHPFVSAIGISKNRDADIAWLYTDSSFKTPFAVEKPLFPLFDSSITLSPKKVYKYFAPSLAATYAGFKSHHKWKMQTAVGGGPVLLQYGEVKVTNNEELKFAGKEITDKHPRTAMGYTIDNKLIILVIEGRNKAAGGATLKQEAQIFKDLGCWEALNLDGGGSSCMLINGKETIKVSDAAGQRPVPAVFIIKQQ